MSLVEEKKAGGKSLLVYGRYSITKTITQNKRPNLETDASTSHPAYLISERIWFVNPEVSKRKQSEQTVPLVSWFW